MDIKTRILTGIVVFIFLVGALAYLFGIKPHFDILAQVGEMNIEDVELSAMPDDLYKGEFSYSKSTWEVELEVKDGQILYINAVGNYENNYTEKGRKVMDSVLEAQSLNVDVISGATRTSKAILKAIENALMTGL